MICPVCGFVSSEDFLKCPQCQTDLRGEGSCGNCGSPLDTETYLYCQACGAINQSRASEENIVCDSHTENPAIGFCVVCGKAVCEDCVETYGGTDCFVMTPGIAFIWRTGKSFTHLILNMRLRCCTRTLGSGASTQRSSRNSIRILQTCRCAPRSSK